MLQLFHLTDTEDIRVKYKYPHYDRIEHYLNTYLYAINDYYSTNSLYVKRPNVLVTLIESLNVDMDIDILELYNILDSDGYYVCNQLGITTNNNNSEPFEDTVLDDVNEYLYYTRESFDIYETDYRKIIGCYMLHTSISDILITHPKRYDHGNFTDIAVYAIDPVKLGIQYRLWYKEQIEDDKDTDAARFIYEVVLVNIIPSIIEKTSITRYMNIRDDIYISKYHNYNPFTLPDIGKFIDEMFKWYIGNFNKHNRITYKEYLKTLITPMGHSFLDIEQLPNDRITRKNAWLIWLSRIDMIIHLLRYVDDKMNKDIINEIKYSLKLANRNKYFEVDYFLTKDILDEKIEELNKILN